MNSVGVRPGQSTLLSWSPWPVPLPGIPGFTWALEQQGPRRCKACLGGKHSEPLTQNNSFIQKLLVYEFPPSLSQVGKPSLMGTTQPPRGSKAGGQVGWAAMETLRPQGPVLHPKQQGGGMGTGGGGYVQGQEPRRALILAWWWEQSKAGPAAARAACFGSCCPQPPGLLPLPLPHFPFTF